MASESYLIRARLEAMSGQDCFDAKTKNSCAAGAVALGIVERLGDLEKLIKKDKLLSEEK